MPADNHSNAIVFGATGGVGVNLINELISCGIRVTAVCRPKSKRRNNIPTNPSVKVIECDLSSLNQLPKLLTDTEYSSFYHLGWDGTFGAERNDENLQKKNIQYALDAVKVAKDVGCSVFIGAGSQSEFGHVEGIMSPDLSCNPDNWYGTAKLSAGIQSRDLCKALGIRHVWCRILSAYGMYDNPNSMISSVTRTLLAGNRPKCTNGDQIWDYIYLKDVARAFRLASEKGVDGSIYCIGTGNTKTLKEYILKIRDLINPDLEIGFGEIPYYPNQVMYMKADISNLQADTGFTPSYSFSQGMKETINWICKE